MSIVSRLRCVRYRRCFVICKSLEIEVQRIMHGYLILSVSALASFELLSGDVR